VKIAAVILDYLKVLVWPGVVITLACVFRAQLRHVLDRVTRVETPAGSVELAMTAQVTYEQAARVAAELPEVSLPQAERPEAHDEPSPPASEEERPEQAPPQRQRPKPREEPSPPASEEDAVDHDPDDSRKGDQPGTVTDRVFVLRTMAGRRMGEAFRAQEQGNTKGATELAWRAVHLAITASNPRLTELTLLRSALARSTLDRADFPPQMIVLYLQLNSLHRQLQQVDRPDDYVVATFVTSCEVFLSAIGVPAVQRSTVPGRE
jgi:hypothetical protein